MRKENGRLDVVEVRAHTDVGLEQVVRPVLVLHPVVVEEHVGAGEPELVGQRERLARPPHLADVGVRVPDAEEVDAHVRQAGAELVDRAQQRERVEPVVDPTTPEDDLVVLTDARDDAAQHVAGRFRWAVVDPERHDGDERARVARCVS